jgi:hypothetical protein
MLNHQISLDKLVTATDAYQSNFFGNNVVMVQQVQMVQISLVPRWSRSTFANNSNFFGNQYQASDASFQISNGQAGYSATSAGGSNFFGSTSGYSNKCL